MNRGTAWAQKALKYGAIGRVTLRNHLAYIADFLTRSVFLIVIMYIFVQLWQATYEGEGTETIAGYSMGQLIWYILLAESLTIAFPSLTTRVEEEVKSGEVGYRLTKPYSYIGYHYAAYAGEVAVRLAVNLAVGLAIGCLAFGWPSLGFGWIGFLWMAAGGITVNFLLNMLLALCAFWVEETRGLEFVYHKLLFTIGGMLMPLELFPGALQDVCRWLPFQTVLYFPAKAAVRWDSVELAWMTCVQWFWIAALAGAVLLVYRLAVRKLNVNGG